MSSPKQKQIEIAKYPHVKKNWIKAIMNIRRGGVFKGEYIWWNIKANMLPTERHHGKLFNPLCKKNTHKNF